MGELRQRRSQRRGMEHMRKILVAVMVAAFVGAAVFDGMGIYAIYGLLKGISHSAPHEYYPFHGILGG